jgi:hypothetical protein
MSTRSAIIVKDGDIYRGVFCHWDGYPSWNGKILQEHYNSLDRALALVSLGWIEVLAPRLAPDLGYPAMAAKEDANHLKWMQDRGFMKRKYK